MEHWRKKCHKKEVVKLDAPALVKKYFQSIGIIAEVVEELYDNNVIVQCSLNYKDFTIWVSFKKEVDRRYWEEGIVCLVLYVKGVIKLFIQRIKTYM